MLTQDPRRSEDRVPGEGNLSSWREDPHSVAAVIFLARTYEGRFRVVHLRREKLHRLDRQVLFAHHHGELIPGIRPLGKDIHQVEAMRHESGAEASTCAAMSTRVPASGGAEPAEIRR